MYAAAVSSLDIVAEGEERVRTETHAGQLIEPCSLLLTCKHIRLNCKCLLPLTENIHVVVADVDIDCVIAVCSSDTGKELKAKHLLVLAQPPVVGLIACEPRAVNTALLARADTDRLTALYVAHGVGLRVLESDE